ncbi:hypothetical protein D3C87_1938590 [compost metagenome]
MVRLTIGISGQVVLDPDLMDELGVKPGDEIEVAVPSRSAPERMVDNERRPASALLGLFAHKAVRPVSIEEMNEAIALGWAGEVKY